MKLKLYGKAVRKFIRKILLWNQIRSNAIFTNISETRKVILLLSFTVFVTTHNIIHVSVL